MNAIVTPVQVPSLEDTSEGKFKSRRYRLALIALTSLNAVTLFLLLTNPEAANSSLLQAYGLILTGILGAYYASGYGDRRIAKQIITSEGQQNGMMDFGRDINGGDQ